jgi:hypothetical protein
MSKQTALQWYIKQCENIKYNPLEKNGYTIAKEKITNQALEMEREQIENAWNSCGESIMTEEFDNAEQYYEQTYRV